MACNLPLPLQVSPHSRCMTQTRAETQAQAAATCSGAANLSKKWCVQHGPYFKVAPLPLKRGLVACVIGSCSLACTSWQATAFQLPSVLQLLFLSLLVLYDYHVRPTCGMIPSPPNCCCYLQGRQKITLAKTFLGFKLDLLLVDVDVVLLRNVMEYFRRCAIISC